MPDRDPSSPADRRKNPARKKTERRKSDAPAPKAKAPDRLREAASKRPRSDRDKSK
jgi:hypothetical protein